MRKTRNIFLVFGVVAVFLILLIVVAMSMESKKEKDETKTEVRVEQKNPKVSDIGHLNDLLADEDWTGKENALQDTMQELIDLANKEMEKYGGSVEEALKSGMSLDEILSETISYEYQKSKRMNMIGNLSSNECPEDVTNSLYNEVMLMILKDKLDEAKEYIDSKATTYKFTMLRNYKIGALYSDIELLKSMKTQSLDQISYNLRSLMTPECYLYQMMRLTENEIKDIIVRRDSLIPTIYTEIEILDEVSENFNETEMNPDLFMEISRFYSNPEEIERAITITFKYYNPRLDTTGTYKAIVLGLYDGSYKCYNVIHVDGDNSFYTIPEYIKYVNKKYKR